MKIQAINNQISSKGLYIDRSKENHGNWKMTYKPYSWELNADGKPYIAPKEKIDISDTKLPVNEELFTYGVGDKPDVSKDIYGTISYYCYPSHINNGEMRRNVIQEEPMDREESLKVYKDKLLRFEDLKKEQLEKELVDNINIKKIDSIDSGFRHSSSEYDSKIFGKNSNKRNMDDSFEELYKLTKDVYKNAMTYVKTNLSFPGLQENIRRINEELDLIKSAKEEGIAIDISKRSGENPDAALLNFIDKAKESDVPFEKHNRLVILSNGLITLKELFSKAQLSSYQLEYIKNHKDTNAYNIFKKDLQKTVQRLITK